jgi:glycerol-3-phosphate dehydrogenase
MNKMKVYKLSDEVTETMLQLTLDDLKKMSEMYKAGSAVNAAGVMIAIAIDTEETNVKQEVESKQTTHMVVESYQNGKRFNVIDVDEDDDFAILMDDCTRKQKTIKYTTYKSGYKRIN